MGGLDAVNLGDLADTCWRTVDTGDDAIVVNIDKPVSADRSRLQQLLENLFRNSIEHGGEEVTVTVGELADGFFVEDDGPGIPSDEHAAVFESGFSTAQAGTGLGLSIVEEVIEAHDWNIQVTRGSEGGARFEITGVDFPSP